VRVILPLSVERALDSDMENVVSYSTIYTNMIAYYCVLTVKYAEGIIRLLSERKEPFGILMEEIIICNLCSLRI
jgi:hypothetical protein